MTQTMADLNQAQIDETAIKHSLKHQGASESHAGAIADAAQTANLNKMEVSYDDTFATPVVEVQSTPVPDVLHERLTGMGFRVMDKYDPKDGDALVCAYEDP